MNHEYLPHVKKNWDCLQPILHLAKSIPSLKDKCKMVDDSLIINGSKYTIEDIPSLPEEITACKATQKSNDTHLAFHGKFSPYINFHLSVLASINVLCAVAFSMCSRLGFWTNFSLIPSKHTL